MVAIQTKLVVYLSPTIPVVVLMRASVGMYCTSGWPGEFVG